LRERQVGIFHNYTIDIFGWRLAIKVHRGVKRVHLKTLCSRWLEDNFKIDSNIEHVNVLPQKEIDKTLGLIGVAFDFTLGNSEGNAIAFFDADEVALVSNNPVDVFKGIDIKYWNENSERIEEEIKQCL
jgi:hypothetical protein